MSLNDIRTEIVKAVTIIYSAQKKPAGEADFALYVEALGDLTIEQVRHGLRRYAREHVSGWITSAEFRLLCINAENTTPETLKSVAFMVANRAMSDHGVYNTVIFADTAIAVAVNGAFGGWHQWGMTTQALEWQRKAFNECYHPVAVGKGLCFGIYEHNNEIELQRGGQMSNLRIAGDFSRKEHIIADYIYERGLPEQRGRLAFDICKNTVRLTPDGQYKLCDVSTHAKQLA